MGLIPHSDPPGHLEDNHVLEENPMNIKKFLLISLFAVSPIFTLSVAVAEQDQTQWLFVQTAADFISDGDSLTIPYEREIFAFTDRPNRMHAYMTAQEFASLWNTGEDSFSSNPPNAVLTWVADGAVSEAEVVLTAAEVDERGRSITYTIALEDGQTLPMNGAQASLFVDGWYTEDGRYCVYTPLDDYPMCSPPMPNSE